MRYVIIILMLLSPSIGLAQQVTDLSTGEVAPFDGILLSPEAYAELVSGHEFELKKQKLECELKIDKQKLEYELKIGNINIELRSEKRAREIESNINQQYIKQLEDKYVGKSGGWESFDFEVGIASGILSSIVFLFVLDSIEDKVEQNE